ncbi:hypothetical protein [Cryobacterium zhongshanensis]|uniref:Uncharacterized protein n=1 Tax=Cryobacterium zhongshanensis TaxID=2928153 RepID=A0AA41QY52_9MICO|nr:hypothetical protein [Cryobacterium zhongshanensis]MCI4658081.1 hypothetical protein [Cryobacterium zhongshanensis]
MKAGAVITAVSALVLALVVLVFPSPLGLILSVAGVVVGFLVLTFQGYRLRSKEGWKPIASQSGVHQDAQFAVLILIPLIVLLVGASAAILQIRALVVEHDSNSWVLLALSLGLIAGALVLFAYLRKVRRNEARGTHEDT